MKRFLKIIAGFIVAIIIVSAVIVGFGLSKINGIVKDIIETTGTETTLTKVLVGGVDIKITEGSGAITGLSIANPAGYTDGKLLSVGKAALQIDLESLTKNVKVIKKIDVSGVKLLAEQKNISDTNIQALLKNIEKSTPSSGGDKSASSSSGEDVRLMIESLQFGESQITLKSEQYGEKLITLPAYTQKNIGNKTSGLTPEQLSDVIIKSLLNKVEKVVKRSIREEAKDKVEEKVKEKLTEKLKESVSEEDIDKLKSLFK